jgi:hypothetical protein
LYQYETLWIFFRGADGGIEHANSDPMVVCVLGFFADTSVGALRRRMRFVSRRDAFYPRVKEPKARAYWGQMVLGF